MIESNIWFYAILKQFINEMIVVGHAFFVYFSRSIWHKARPAKGKAICLYSHLFHHGNIFFVAMILVTGYISCMAFIHFPRGFAKNVPDIEAFSIFIGSALHLIGCGGSAPDKILSKSHNVLLVIFIYDSHAAFFEPSSCRCLRIAPCYALSQFYPSFAYCGIYWMSIASPKLKKRYRSFTASS